MNCLALGVNLKIALNTSNIELGKGEDLRELTTLKVCFFPKLLSVTVDNVTESIDQVALVVAAAAKLIAETFSAL
jgi:hypothetical protein